MGSFWCAKLLEQTVKVQIVPWIKVKCGTVRRRTLTQTRSKDEAGILNVLKVRAFFIALLETGLIQLKTTTVE